MLPALVVRRRPPDAPGRVLQLEPFQVGVEGQVEVEPPLLAVADHVEPGAHLIHHRRQGGIARRLLEVVRAHLLRAAGDELQPPREGV
jgi:hypothetical protein